MAQIVMIRRVIIAGCTQILPYQNAVGEETETEPTYPTVGQDEDRKHY